MAEKVVSGWTRKTKPEGFEVPKGAPPGGIWNEIVNWVQGTTRQHRIVRGYRYLPPAGDGSGPELWPSDLEAGPTLVVPRVTDPEIISGSGKVRAAGEKE